MQNVNCRYQTSPRCYLWWVILSTRRPFCVVCAWPLCANMPSFTKPDVHKISQRRQRRTQPRFQPTSMENWWSLGHLVFELCSRTNNQTGIHTDCRQTYGSASYSIQGAKKKRLTFQSTELTRVNTLDCSSDQRALVIWTPTVCNFSIPNFQPFSCIYSCVNLHIY